MIRLLPALLLALAACRPPADVSRRAPLDFASLPGPTSFGTEATLAQRWSTTLKAHWLAGERVEVTGVDGVVVRGVVHRVANSRGAVVIIGGRTEPLEKYAEVIDDLNTAGYSTYGLDHRGHGASDRMLPNHDKCYVKQFADYVSDLHAFITTVVQPDAPPALFILAHSMGGAVATLYVDAHPEGVTALATTSPMLDIKTGGFPPSVASTLGLSACSVGDSTAYALGYGDYVEEATLADSTVTSSEARWAWKQQLVRDDPALRLGGVTWQWLCESLTGSSAAVQLGRYSPVPTLIFQAGLDTVVNPAGEQRYCADAPRCQLSVIAQGKHELLQERDELRNTVLEQTLKFFSAGATP